MSVMMGSRRYALKYVTAYAGSSNDIRLRVWISSSTSASLPLGVSFFFSTFLSPLSEDFGLLVDDDILCDCLAL